jgi:uracil phosphoribosyltransferase
VSHIKRQQLRLFDHPLIQRDLTILRDRRTPGHLFRSVLRRASILMAYETTKDLTTKKVRIRTPLEATGGVVLGRPVVLVPILRAGLGMVGGFVEVLPDANVGHIGLYRNEETLQPVDYYFKVPSNLSGCEVIILDPMLATGGSAVAAVRYLKARGARRLRLVCLVAAPEGVRALAKAHRDLIIYTAMVDRRLNDQGYILPGLGDAGDRLFGTG